MRPAEFAHRSIVPRCLLITVLLVAAVACASDSSSYTPMFATSTVATTTTAKPTTTSTSTTSTSTTTTTIPRPTTTTLPPITSGGVVRVANATGVEDAAQELTYELAGVGFALDDPTNAAGKDEILTVSKIYVKPGSEAVAASVSYLMGGIEMLRMPTPAWIFGGTAALGNTTVLVMLGSDLAGIPLQVMRFQPGRQGPD